MLWHDIIFHNLQGTELRVGASQEGCPHCATSQVPHTGCSPAIIKGQQQSNRGMGIQGSSVTAGLCSPACGIHLPSLSSSRGGVQGEEGGSRWQQGMFLRFCSMKSPLCGSGEQQQ